MSIKIALDAGHGRYTQGKRCLKSIDPNETREWILNNRVCIKVQELLSQYEDVELLRLDDPTGETDVSLNTRTNKANKWGADWVFSFHHNAGILGGSGGGIVVFCYISNNAAERAMRKAIYEECVARGGLTGRAEPLNSANFHMVREPKGNAILIEYGFMDSTKDTPVILNPEYSISMAEGTVAAIAAQLNLKKSKSEEDDEMTAEDRKLIKELQESVNLLIAKVDAFSAQHVMYHWYEQLPNWSRPTIQALHQDGKFVGNGPGDMDISSDLMRTLYLLAKNGVFDTDTKSYKDIK